MEVPSSESEDVYLTPGRHLTPIDMDNNFDLLVDLFEKLQLAAFEASDMMLDMLTFMHNTELFSGIMRVTYRSIVIPAKEGSYARDRVKREPLSKDLVGIVYLISPTSGRNDELNNSELNIGVIIHPQFQRKGYARKAITLALDHAFNISRSHRVQAVITSPFTHAKYPAYKLFTSVGFKQEGIRRRSYFNHLESEWQDTAYLAVLNTEWLMQSHESRSTPWDEMIDRHQKEREAVLHWEDITNGADETETIHHMPLDESVTQESAAGVDGTSVASSKETSRATTPDFYIDSEMPAIMPGDEEQSTSSVIPSSPTSTSSHWDLIDGDSSFDEFESELEFDYDDTHIGHNNIA
ncbi:hypothetical protein AMATHDRAFT_67823 [Amanita thiersii Skay4041]|uniref:N-acetyltransferase domain-containing protein n=1 Tax=Amanita thiersii Skay4041 TaxID=703135 RepID=A0A2A9NGL5_9AGAR|nr:hypothetical protein AMATHDRAFT_67823 [Amanita thiersii Skay4041]